MRRFRPIYIGRRQFDAPPSGAELIVPQQKAVIRAKADAAAIVGLRNPRPFIKALEGRELTLIHSHFAVDATYALPLARRLGVPLVTTLHGFDVNRSRRDMVASLRPALVNAVVFTGALQRQGDLFICVSTFIRKVALERGFPEEKLLLHHIGVDTVRLTPRDDAGEEGLIVHVGRLVEVKGTIFLLRAVAAIRSRVPHVRLVIIGEGPLRAALEAEARALGIHDAVEFLGVQPHDITLRWIKKAAVLAMPSVLAADGNQEGLGMVSLEAGAQGVPVVASRSGGISDAVRHGITGLTHPEGDVAAMADHLHQLLSNPGLRRDLGAGGRALMARDFDISRQTAKLEDVYAQLIAGRQGSKMRRRKQRAH